MKNFVTLFLIGTGIILTHNRGYAQIDSDAFGYYNEALLFSQTLSGGSARIQGIAGSQIALGGDLSNIYSNPAGLGFFNESQFSISPTFNFHSNETNYLGTSTRKSGAKLNFDNLGIVFKTNSGGSDAWRGGSFGISLTNINNFNNRFSYQGENADDSIIDSFLEQADGSTVSQFDGGNSLASLAYNNYLIGPRSILDENEPDDVYFTDINGVPFQSEDIVITGGQRQWSFSYGGNLYDKFYFGLGLGLQTINYRSEKTYTESFEDGPMSSLSLTENLRIDGTGINATLGVIVRPTNYFRFGLSVVTPSFISLDEEYDVSMKTSWNNFQYDDETVLNEESAESDIILSKYELTTPLKLSGGVAFFFNKNGFITADIDYIDYTKNNLSSIDFSPNADNNTIRDLYTSAINFRIGGEYRYDILRFRLGVAQYGNPYNIESIDKSRSVYSLGAGLKLVDFYVDLGLSTSKSNYNYSPYTFFDGTGPIAKTKNTQTKAVITFGFNF